MRQDDLNAWATPTVAHKVAALVARRGLLLAALGAAALTALGPGGASAGLGMRTRPIPSSGQALPVIGMGTWITFNVGDDPVLRAERLEVLRAFFEAGGGMIDSSPMYASSQAVVGDCLARLGPEPGLFSATKVWTSSGAAGPEQIAQSRAAWGLPRFDLLQVHNLLGWEAHLETLAAMKAEGRLGYLGITTSHGRRHQEFARIMERYPLDFVQFTYNLVDREAERRLLPLAQERRIAVIVNRPFRGGRLIDHLQSYPLPDWAAEIDCANWAQFLLKFIVSHPTVTCVIPATSQVAHMRENMGAGLGRLPDAGERAAMLRYVEEL